MAYANNSNTYTVNINISLKMPIDPECMTVKRTFEEMGYGCLSDIKKEDVWSFEVLAETKKDALRYGQEFASRHLVNDNKQIGFVYVGDNIISNVKAKDGYFAPSVFVFPRTIEVPDAVAEVNRIRLEDRLGYKGIINSCKRGTIWTPVLDVESAEKADNVLNMMIDDLLCNPSSHEKKILF